LFKTTYIYITADCWLAFIRSYLSVACQWIDKEILQRKNVKGVRPPILGMKGKGKEDKKSYDVEKPIS